MIGEPYRLDGLFERLDGIEPLYSYARLNKRDDYRATAKRGVITLRTPYDAELVERLKSRVIRGVWNPEERSWSFVVREANAEDVRELLRDFGVVFGEDVRRLLHGDQAE